MEKGKGLSVGLLVKPAEGHRQGLTHEENGRLHGVGYSTSKYAQRWCEKMRSTAETYLKTQSPYAPRGLSRQRLGLNSDDSGRQRRPAPSARFTLQIEQRSRQPEQSAG